MPGRSFRLILGAAVAGSTESIASIRHEQSADGETGWAESLTLAIAALVVDGVKRRFDDPAADPTQYSRLIPVTASGAERQAARIYPPEPATPETWTLYAYTVDAGMGIAEGIKLTAQPLNGAHVAAGDSTVVEKVEALSDAVGYVALTLPAAVGDLEVILGTKRKKIPTAGLAGTMVNWKDVA